MDFGIFLQPVHAPTGNIADNIHNDRETIVLADELGFSECWIGEHVAAPAEPIASPLAFLASVMDRTKRIKLGTGVLCLPHQHPAIVASQAAMFDHMTRGRFQMGIGPGGLSSDFEVFGTGDAAKRTRMMIESIDMILEIWASDPPYDIKGEFWQTVVQDMSRAELGVGEIMKPYQKPHPPLSISIMSPDSGSAYAAGLKGWIPMSGASLIQPRYVASHWKKYEEGAAKAGRKADRRIWRVARSVWVDESSAAAEDYIGRPDGVFNFYYRYMMSAFIKRGTLEYQRPDGREKDESVTWLDIARSQLAWGTPAMVLDKLIWLTDKVGPFGTLLLTGHEWDDVPRCRRSMQLFAEQVAPKLSQHMAARLAA